jgi:arylsulfatase
VIDGSNVTGYSKKADFHYAVNPERKWALYDIEKDLAQENNIASNFPEIFDEMSGVYEQWWTEVFPHIQRKAKDPSWSQDFKSNQE